MPRGSSDGWLPPEDGTITREQYHRNRGSAAPKPMPRTTGVSSSPTRSQKSRPTGSTAGTSPRPASESTRPRSGSSPTPPASPAERRTVRRTAARRVPAPLPPTAKGQALLEEHKVERPDPLTIIRESGASPTCQACDANVPASWVYRLPPEPNAMGKPSQRLMLCGHHAAVAVKAYVGGTLIPGEAIWGDAA